MKIPKLLKKCLKQKNLINIMLLIVIIYLLIQAYKKVFEGFNPEKDELVLFHMNGCGHCVNFMPEWDKFSKETQGVLNTRKVEASDDPQAIEKAGVTSFPTIGPVNNNGKLLSEYNGPRTLQGLKDAYLAN